MKILHISFAITIFGILILLLLSNILQPPLTKINQLTTKQLNKQIQIQGEIIKIQTQPTFQIITIQDSTSEINAILTISSNIKINQKIILIGTLTQYKDQLQIQTNKIKK